MLASSTESGFRRLQITVAHRSVHICKFLCRTQADGYLLEPSFRLSRKCILHLIRIAKLVVSSEATRIVSKRNPCNSRSACQVSGIQIEFEHIGLAGTLNFSGTSRALFKLGEAAFTLQSGRSCHKSLEQFSSFFQNLRP
jgi:hypothetical protein